MNPYTQAMTFARPEIWQETSESQDLMVESNADACQFL
jgi:hypothetical protein